MRFTKNFVIIQKYVIHFIRKTLVLQKAQEAKVKKAKEEKNTNKKVKNKENNALNYKVVV